MGDGRPHPPPRHPPPPIWAPSAAGARVVRQEPNHGCLAAIRRGFREARGELVVVLGADGQEEGLTIAAETLAAVAPLVRGIHLHAPGGEIGRALRVLEGAYTHVCAPADP